MSPVMPCKRNNKAPAAIAPARLNVTPNRNRFGARDRNVHQISNATAVTMRISYVVRLRRWKGQSVCARVHTMAMAPSAASRTPSHHRIGKSEGFFTRRDDFNLPPPTQRA